MAAKSQVLILELDRLVLCGGKELLMLFTVTEKNEAPGLEVAAAGAGLLGGGDGGSDGGDGSGGGGGGGGGVEAGGSVGLRIDPVNALRDAALQAFLLPAGAGVVRPADEETPVSVLWLLFCPAVVSVVTSHR